MVSPISCTECRRRKIRCSKEQPQCSYCTKKRIACTYPAKFRSIEVHRIEKSTKGIEHSEIDKYRAKIKDLEAKLTVSQDLISIFDNSSSPVNTADRDETRRRYYGTNSIKSLENSTLGELETAETITRASSEKKGLPVLSGEPLENMRLIRSSVEEFFDPTKYSYLNDMFDHDEIVAFLDQYEEITAWNHDELLMSLQMIVLDVLKNALNSDLETPIKNWRQKLLDLLADYYHISKAQPTETVVLIKTQVILLNYFHYCFDYSKSWKMLFQIVSNCYSVGLHITQGPLWLKINLFEAIMCSISSRPSILRNNMTRKDLTVNDGNVGELEFIELLRLKNDFDVDRYIHNKSVSIAEVMAMDLKFDMFSKFLTHMLTTDLEQVEKQRIRLLLLMLTSFHLNLHYETFEHYHQSDRKLLKLLIEFMSILNSFVTPNTLHTLRNTYSSLECLFYQFILLFLKYVHSKTVKTMLHNDPSDHEDIQKLVELQGKLAKLRKENQCYVNERVVTVFDTMVTMPIADLSSTNNSSPSRTDGEVQDGVQELLDTVNEADKVLRSLLDIPQYLFFPGS